MEYLGFILFLIGAGSMDSEGNWFYVAIATTLLGLLLMYTGEVIKEYIIWKRKANRKEI
jgi:hypothetical protein